MVFGNGFGDRYSLRVTLFLVLVGLSGLFVEIINAFEYLQGARSVFKVQESYKLILLALSWQVKKHDSKKRLTLIVSDPKISAALLILSLSKMILIYLNYRLWSIKLKVIYAKVLDTLFLERDGNYLNLRVRNSLTDQ